MNPGALERVQDWSDISKGTLTWQLLVLPRPSKCKTLTINRKLFGPAKVEVVELALSAPVGISLSGYTIRIMLYVRMNRICNL